MLGDLDLVRQVFEDTAVLHRRMADAIGESIVRAAGVIKEAVRGGRRVLVFGNGGSAASAQHFAAELVGRFGDAERKALPALALGTDAAVMSAVANDFGFQAVFAREIQAFGQAGDVAMALTTSGQSANVNEGLRWALHRQLTTVALTGRDGGETGKLADVHINVSDDSTQRVQEVHQTILHVLCELVERP